MNIVFFKNKEELRNWFEMYAQQEPELLVGYYKLHTKIASVTWSESVDVALCYGWIDGIRKSFDAQSYYIRFTPRRKNSIWSKINIDKMETLLKAGLVKEQGLKIYQERQENKSGIYAHENEVQSLSKSEEEYFKNQIQAWSFFQQTSAKYQKLIIHWINSAKQPQTRLKRIDKFAEAALQGKKLFY